MQKVMLGAEEVGAALGMSRSYAYKVIKRLNGELEARGYLTIPGKVERGYFESRLFATPKEGSHVR